RVQQHLMSNTRLYLPVGTYALAGVQPLYEGPQSEALTTPPLRRSTDMLTVVAAMAREIVGQSTDPVAQASKIEAYLSSRFQYVANPAQIGHAMTVDQFLLKDHRGHCEYFAAGMVALLTALDVPARIAGGFYGGQFNPLTGYFVIRREDAHAWVEVWTGNRWTTFDPTPVALRPGMSPTGFVRSYANAIGEL